MALFQHSIPRLLERFPRAGLLQIPAIIHRLPRLSSHLGQELLILRDDLTGFGIGGNKTRKLDYLIGHALKKKAETLVTQKATSFSRNAAMAASACGLDLHVVLDGSEEDQNEASQALFRQCGTQLHYAPRGEGEFGELYRRCVESLKGQGRTVYELHPGGSDTVGALGYVRVIGEILGFSTREGIHFGHIVHSTGSVGTQVGLILGQSIEAYDTRILGISASKTASVQSQRILRLGQDTAVRLGTTFDEGKITVDDRFLGPGYAIPSEEGEEATRLFASLEGIHLDPVYTAKAAAALFDPAVRRGFKGGSVLFIHTGGNAGLFY